MRADQTEPGRGAVLVEERPEPSVEAVGAAVEAVAAVVGAEPVVAVGQGQVAVADPVGVATDRAPDVVRRREVGSSGRVPEGDVPAHAVTAGDLEVVHGGAQGEQAQDRPRGTAELDEVDLTAVGQPVEHGDAGTWVWHVGIVRSGHAGRPA